MASLTGALLTFLLSVNPAVSFVIPFVGLGQIVGPLSDGLFGLNLNPGPCPTGVQVIAARGTDQGWPFGPAMQLLASSILQQIPGSQAIGVVYPATNGIPTYVVSETLGAQNMTAYIKYFAQRCPNTPQVIIGYSQGAQVVMDAVCGISAPSWPTQTAELPAAYQHNVRAVVVYGDPSHKINMPYDRGTSTHNGIFRRPRSACPLFANRIASWCDAGDPYCDSGSNITVHHSYKDKYNSAALAWVLSKFNITAH